MGLRIFGDFLDDESTDFFVIVVMSHNVDFRTLRVWVLDDRTCVLNIPIMLMTNNFSNKLGELVGASKEVFTHGWLHAALI